MKFYDIYNKDKKVSFRDAVLQKDINSLSSVFMPEHLEKISASLIYKDPPPSFRDLAFEITKQFCSEDISDSDLMSIIAQFFPHRIPVNPIAPTTYIMELCHGDTCNYKDISEGFFAHLLEYFNKDEEKAITAISATAGARAAAMANAISELKSIKAIILYPKDSLSEVQSNIISSAGKNVFCCAIDGTLADCNNLVNKAFADKETKRNLNLVPAGSYNIASILPQIAVFVYGTLSVLHRCAYDNKIERPSIITSIPSGGFSALAAAIFAKKMGTPIKAFIAAENENKVISDWLNTDDPKIFDTDDYAALCDKLKHEPIHTNTPALDFTNPSNFIRMLEAYSFEELKKFIIPHWMNNEETVASIRACNTKTGCVIDPYTAMACMSWYEVNEGNLKGIEQENMVGLIAQTSHPGKFPKIMKEAIGRPPSLPDKLERLSYTQKKETIIPNDYDKFKEWLSDSQLI